MESSDSNIYASRGGGAERTPSGGRRTRRVSLRSQGGYASSGDRKKVRPSRRRRLKRAVFWSSLLLLVLVLAIVLVNERWFKRARGRDARPGGLPLTENAISP